MIKAKARKGITPVVAIVLLLLLTISAAGAAFAFSQNLIEGELADARQESAASFQIQDISCTNITAPATTGEVTIDGFNDGNVDLTGAEVFVYWRQNNSLHSQNTTGNIDWTVSEGFETNSFILKNPSGGDNNLSKGSNYRVEIDFDEGGGTSGFCTAN